MTATCCCRPWLMLRCQPLPTLPLPRTPCWLLRLPLLGLYLNPLLQQQRMYMMLRVSLLRLCVLML